MMQLGRVCFLCVLEVVSLSPRILSDKCLQIFVDMADRLRHRRPDMLLPCVTFSERFLPCVTFERGFAESLHILTLQLDSHEQHFAVSFCLNASEK